MISNIARTKALILIRLCMSGLPFLFSLLAAKYVSDNDFSLIYQAVSLSAALGITLRFGFDLTVKRSFKNAGGDWRNNASKQTKYIHVLRFLVGSSVALFTLDIDIYFFYILSFFVYLHFSIYSLQERLSGRTFSALFVDPILIYVPLILCIPAYLYRESYYYMAITIIIALFVLWNLLRFWRCIDFFNYKLLDDINHERSYEGFFSVVSISSGSLLVFYLANLENAKELIIAFQIGLVLATVRTLELNWFYKDLMRKIDLLETTGKLMVYTLKRLLFSIFLSSIAALILAFFGFDFDFVAFLLFCGFEIVCFVTSPYIAYLQAILPKNTNRGLFIAYGFGLITVLSSIFLLKSLHLVFFGLAVIGLYRIYTAFTFNYKMAGIAD